MKNFKDYITTINEWKLNDQSSNNVNLDKIFDVKDAEKQQTLEDLFNNVIINKFKQLTNYSASKKDRLGVEVHSLKHYNPDYIELYKCLPERLQKKINEDTECFFELGFSADSYMQICGIYIKNEYLAFILGFPSQKQVKAVDKVLKELNFVNSTVSGYVIPQNMYIIYGKHVNNKYFCELVCKFLYNLLDELGVRTNLNFELKPGEVLPGYTFDDIKKRYDKVFDDVRMLRTGNICLGKPRQSGFYGDSKFTIFVDIIYNDGVLIRRNNNGVNNTFILKYDADSAFDALDNKFRKKGYKI